MKEEEVPSVDFCTIRERKKMVVFSDDPYGFDMQWSWQTVVMGSIKKPKLFWISAAAPLTSVILSTVLVYALTYHTSAISTLPKGLNPPSANMLYFSGTHLAIAIKTGIVTGILSLTEGIAVGRTFASPRNYQIDGNKEMIATGFCVTLDLGATQSKVTGETLLRQMLFCCIGLCHSSVIQFVTQLRTKTVKGEFVQTLTLIEEDVTSANNCR